MGPWGHRSQAKLQPVSGGGANLQTADAVTSTDKITFGTRCAGTPVPSFCILPASCDAMHCQVMSPVQGGGEMEAGFRT